VEWAALEEKKKRIIQVIDGKDMRMSRAWLSLLFCASASYAQVAPPVSLRIPDEREPPGGLLETKVALTESEPIVTGSCSREFAPGPLGAVQDVALFSPLESALEPFVRVLHLFLFQRRSRDCLK
jgi:hypothetical protein